MEEKRSEDDSIFYRRKRELQEHRLEYFVPEHILAYIRRCEGNVPVPSVQHFETVAMFCNY